MVYAKIIYLLMVVISGALCTVEDYVIMSQCAHNKAIYLAAEGTVSVTDISQTQNITIVGRPDFVNNNFKIALYAKETQRYLCFNDHWKLVGMKELQDTCYFNEAIVHGYFVFRSVVDLNRRIGFTQRGRAVGPKKTVNDACYMFTKIPTDQFFHQHTHFSTAKTKTTTTATTKIPKTAYTRAPYTLNAGKISGSGTGNGNGSGRGSIRTKPNKRFKNHQRQNDTVSHYHSGSGSGSGGGSGSGSGNGDGNKKLKRQRNGNKTRRQKQEMQQQQQQLSGHNYNLSNPNNSTYLNSSRKNIILSQNSLYNNNNNNNNNNSYTNKNKQYNNSINNNHNNNSKHPPQSHQVRHHHNDPNKVARRQQHDHRPLKTKQRQRLRPSTTSTSYSSSSSPSPIINSTKLSHSGLSTTQSQSQSQSEIKPTSVTATTILATASANSNTQSSTTIVVSKRKSRRRKNDKLQKKHDYSKEQRDKGHATATYTTSSVEPTYEEDDEFTSSVSSTDYTWMTNDIMMSSVKPTSASLPSWETWYPSLSTLPNDKNNGYSSTESETASASTSTDFNGDDIPHYSTTLESSSTTTDLDKNTLRTLQTSLPLPTSMLTTTLTDENGIDATILPSLTTDLGTITTTTTTNTSTYTETDFWSTSINDDTHNNDLLHTDVGNTDMHVTKDLHSNYATPQLEDVQTAYGLNTESTFSQDISTSSQSNSKKEETKPSTVATTVNSNDRGHEAALDQEGDNTTPVDLRTTEAKTDTSTRATDLHNCAYSTAAAAVYNERESTMKTATDCISATTKTTGYIANHHNFRPQMQKKNVTTATTTTTTTTATKLNSSSPKISQSSQTPLPRLITTTTTLQQQQSQTQIGNDLELKTATDVATTARTPSLNKSSVLTPLTTRRTLRKSTQRLLATPFHQLTYVRNEAGDIDIDSIDNISIYPEILDNENVDEPQIKTSTSRLTMISGYLPTSATVTLPESIRIAKIKINRERKRMLRLRNISNYT